MNLFDPTEDRDSSDADLLRSTLDVLTRLGTTQSTGYAAVWEGWCNLGAAPQTPALEIPHRRMLLFEGPLNLMRDAPRLAWPNAAGCLQQPNIVWPADRSWCVACEVGEDVEFSVGCGSHAADTLMRSFPGSVRRVKYGEWASFQE